ncbi:MAG TPA: hypothetical protein VG734_11480 [Lacunisphaera sp.]|nr:hypothetical protein [Lacunisphaera sp.]
MKSKVNVIISFAALAAGFLAPHARAAISVGARDNVQIGGFFSQGWLYSSNNNYPTANQGGTWDFREMAVNVSTTFGSHLRVGGQAFAQSFGELGGDKVILDWAVADYNFSPAFGLRAGRVKYPKGLYGEALDLDVVRPYVFLPGAVYSPVMRDFNASFDGAMVYGTLSAGRNSFDYKLFYGDIPMKASMGVAEFYNNAGLYTSAGATALDMDSVQGGQLTWNTPISGLKAGVSYSKYTNLGTDGKFVAVPSLNLHSNIPGFSWKTLSAEYSRGDWVFAAEWQRAYGSFGYSAPPVVTDPGSPVGWDGWYVSASRRLNARFEVGSYYGFLKNRYPGSTTASAQKRQIDYALSLRVDLNEHVLVKLEGHYFDGTYQTFNTPRIPNPSATRKNTNSLLAVKTTLSF